MHRVTSFVIANENGADVVPARSRAEDMSAVATIASPPLATQSKAARRLYLRHMLSEIHAMYGACM
jgi:hypothetical protein